MLHLRIDDIIFIPLQYNEIRPGRQCVFGQDAGFIQRRGTGSPEVKHFIVYIPAVLVGIQTLFQQVAHPVLFLDSIAKSQGITNYRYSIHIGRLLQLKIPFPKSETVHPNAFLPFLLEILLTVPGRSYIISKGNEARIRQPPAAVWM